MGEQRYFFGIFFNKLGHRKYLNARERQRFVDAARRMPSKICLFCLTLEWTGARISEVPCANGLLGWPRDFTPRPSSLSSNEAEKPVWGSNANDQIEKFPSKEAAIQRARNNCAFLVSQISH